ncbi:MAG: hypothetical protein RML56_02835 [Burkholderiales bacterium]|nr:hypothetical protein [Burkholderiales bacterium]
MARRVPSPSSARCGERRAVAGGLLGQDGLAADHLQGHREGVDELVGACLAGRERARLRRRVPSVVGRPTSGVRHALALLRRRSWFRRRAPGE